MQGKISLYKSPHPYWNSAGMIGAMWRWSDVIVFVSALDEITPLSCLLVVPIILIYLVNNDSYCTQICLFSVNIWIGSNFVCIFPFEIDNFSTSEKKYVIGNKWSVK